MHHIALGFVLTYILGPVQPDANMLNLASDRHPHNTILVSVHLEIRV